MKKLQVVYLLLFTFVCLSCSDDDHDSTDFDKQVLNIWVSKIQPNIYEPVFEIKEDNTGFFYSKEMFNHGEGHFETIYYKNKILSYKYTKSFGFEFSISDVHKPPYYYIESINQDSAIFIVNRYASSGSSKVKLYTKSFLDSKGFIEIPRSYIEK